MSNTMQRSEIDEVLSRPLSQELLARDLTRLAYVAKDGTPRNVPIGFTWNGSEVVMCTTPNSPKLISLRHNPVVALTIDTEVAPVMQYFEIFLSRMLMSRRAAEHLECVFHIVMNDHVVL